jgi:hypothetical protein
MTSRIRNQAIKFKNKFMGQTTGLKLFLLEHDRGCLKIQSHRPIRTFMEIRANPRLVSGNRGGNAHRWNDVEADWWLRVATNLGLALISMKVLETVFFQEILGSWIGRFIKKYPKLAQQRKFSRKLLWSSYKRFTADGLNLGASCFRPHDRSLQVKIKFRWNSS